MPNQTPKEKALERLKELAKERKAVMYESIESDKEGSKVRVQFDLETINTRINIAVQILLDELCDEQ